MFFFPIFRIGIQNWVMGFPSWEDMRQKPDLEKQFTYLLLYVEYMCHNNKMYVCLNSENDVYIRNGGETQFLLFQ